MELKEIDHQWQQKGHILANWNPTAEPKPYDFIGKFLAGMDWQTTHKRLGRAEDRQFK